MRAIDVFDKGAAIEPARPAIIHGEICISFAELRQQTFRVAAALRRDGIERQRPIAIFAPNDPAVLVALLGLWRAGGIWIPVNTRNALDANIAYLAYVRAEMLFYHSSLAAEVAEICAGVPSLQKIVCLDEDRPEAPSLTHWLGGLDPDDFQDKCDAFGNLDEIVGIFPTGGTTGPAKGVNVSNLGWGTMLATAANALRIGDSRPVCLTTAPLTHAAGPMAAATLGFGATQVIMPGFDAGAVLANIERHGITHLYCPPTALYGLLDHPHVKHHDYASLQRFLLVGSPVSPDRLAQAVACFGPCMCQCYGQVEAPMVITWLPPEDVAAAAAGDRPERLRSCGKPTSLVRLEIMDDAGALLPEDQPGEIVVRGPLVSRDYFEKPEATQEAHAHGWHHTGDVGYRDAAGYIYIVDRKKDMIITGGFNVFSAEVESCIMALAGVLECAAIGVPHAKWGEAIKVIVVAAAGQNLDEESVMLYARKHLGGVKAPKSVEFWPELPKTPANKIDKKAIRTRFWQSADRSVN